MFEPQRDAEQEIAWDAGFREARMYYDELQSWLKDRESERPQIPMNPWRGAGARYELFKQGKLKP